MKAETDLHALIEQELRMGHVRLDECSDGVETKGLQLYDRISRKIQKLSDAKSEVEHMLKACGAEMDVLRARAEAAEHRQAAAEYRAQRIVLDKELLARAEKAEAELAALLSGRPSPNGIGLIASERQRQQAVEGWTPEHDDTHMDAEMIEAARGYLSAAFLAERGRAWNGAPPPFWPWNQSWWKPSDDPILNLVKAGALIAAEIDRLQRAASPIEEPNRTKDETTS